MPPAVPQLRLKSPAMVLLLLLVSPVQLLTSLAMLPRLSERHHISAMSIKVSMLSYIHKICVGRV